MGAGGACEGKFFEKKVKKVWWFKNFPYLCIPA